MADDVDHTERTNTPARLSGLAGWLARRAARRWWVVLRRPGIPAVERRRFEAWLQRSPVHRAAYDEVGRVWRLAGAVTPFPRERAAATRGVPSPLLRPAFQAFAALLVLVAAVWAAERLPTTYSYETPVGRSQRVTLADRSVIDLAPGSRLEVTMKWRVRSVALQRGEVFFDVAHSRFRPFTVEARGVEIRVRGTSFNVHTGPNGVDVAVRDGRVAVSPPRDGAAGRQLTAELVHGQAMFIGDGGQDLRVRRVDVGRISAWREGRLIFDDVPLSTVVADLARYSASPLSIGDERLGTLRVTALFDVAQVDEAVGILDQVLPVSIVRLPRGGAVIVPERR